MKGRHWIVSAQRPPCAAFPSGTRVRGSLPEPFPSAAESEWAPPPRRCSCLAAAALRFLVVLGAVLVLWEAGTGPVSLLFHRLLRYPLLYHPHPKMRPKKV